MTLREYLVSLRFPWAEIPARWRQSLGMAAVFQRLAKSCVTATREWFVMTCRPGTLGTYAGFLARPRRDGESAEDHRERLVRWRHEPVGSSGWVRDEVRRITGTERVIEFPRQGMRFGYTARFGTARFGAGPSLTVGVTDLDQAEVDRSLQYGVDPVAGINYLPPVTFDRIGYHDIG